ncbi:cytochrome c [Salipiger sp. P9]|uniref:c-type cytochrome n=1 Tax=Salipiger pentaromativorans TaxID=2943193 RepID=UPI002157B9D3|nr:cytochrome c [Salipiger pentaromativorans]MCR8549815.1 cytochrome c [Salipiger pentaromativorans]
MRAFAAMGAVLALILPLSAQADQAGEAEYLNHCAACHGVSGTGDGPLAEMMTVPVPDLTQISARNDGAFPMLAMIQVIDGRTGVRGHGYPMPVWGQRFKDSAEEMGSYGSEIEVRGRILSLAYFLESIQAP